MTEASKQWTGQIVEGIFPLRQYLGGSDHSAVFLTEHSEGEPRKAAIKLIPADPATADLQLSSWNFAAQLSHPNLLRLLGTGKCTVAGNDLLYLVMEFAEENLSEILPNRTLTPEETRDMLLPVLDALEYLHGKGFVHGDLKPANILASGDHLKLSSDTISRIGESQVSLRRAGVYDPPEASGGMLTPAADVWSLGTTLVEVLTQRLPDWQPGPHREPAVPANLPAPFQEIARQCLRLEPQRRIAIADIAARLSSRAAAASASAPLGSGASPVVGQMQPSSASPRPMASPPAAPRAALRMQSVSHRPKPYGEAGAKSRFIIPLTVGALAFAAFLTVPRLLTHRSGTQSTPAMTPDRTAGQSAIQKPAESGLSAKPKAPPKHEPAVLEAAKSASPTAQPTTQRTAQVAVPDAVKTTSEKELPSPASSSARTAASEEAAKPAPGGIASARGEVLDQVLPDVSEKARATISGRVRVGIKVRVDSAGAVSDAELDSPGPSKFFADLALKAARKWVFTPPEVSGKSVASEWSLRFVFTQSDTKVTPVQTAP